MVATVQVTGSLAQASLAYSSMPQPPLAAQVRKMCLLHSREAGVLRNGEQRLLGRQEIAGRRIWKRLPSPTVERD